MSVSAETLLELSELRLEPEQMAGVLRILAKMQAKEEDRKKGQRERTRRHREAPRYSNVTVTSLERDNPSPKEKSPTPPKEITPSRVSEPNGSSHSARANDLSEFKAELADLDAERLDAIVKHRRSKNGQLTGHSARLFRRDASACGLSISEAVDTCISRNWITVKPEYLADRRQQATAPPTKKPTAFDALDEISRLKGWNNEPGIIPSTDKDAERLSAVSSGPSGVVVDLRRGHDWRS